MTRCVVVFAAGRAGDPVRHRALLDRISDAGFRKALEGRLPLDFELVDGADHFSFMDVRPPNQPEPMAAAEAYRQRLTDMIIGIASQPS